MLNYLFGFVGYEIRLEVISEGLDCYVCFLGLEGVIIISGELRFLRVGCECVG